MTPSRRTVLAGGAALAASAMLPRPAWAADKLTVLANDVHKVVALGQQGGDVTAAWRARTGTTVDWITFATQPLYERLLREASLRDTSIDVAFILNTQATPRIARLFEPLDPYLQAEPIEDFTDIFPTMVEPLRFDGELHAVPFRHAIGGLHYNEAYLDERGLSGPPRTVEELVEYARKLTYTRADGTKVTGFILVGYPSIVALARAWNGDYITPDYQVVADQPPMVRAITALRDMYKAGAFPKTFGAGSKEDQNTWMQSGRAAMCLAPMGRNALFNDPAKSKFAGRIRTAEIPISTELRDRFPVAPANIEFWSMVIPKNSKRKQEAWRFIRELSSKDNTIKAARNGNGPVRASTYADPTFTAALPYAAAERRVLEVARIPMPAFDDQAKADDWFMEAFEAAMLGMKTPQQAMDELVRRVKPLMPKLPG